MTSKITKDHPKFLCTFDIRDVRELNNFRLSGKHKLVLWALDSRGEDVFPSLERLKGDTGASISTIQRALADLEKIKAVYVVRQRGRVNTYIINRKLIKETAKQEQNSLRIQDKLMREQIDSATKGWEL